MLFNNGLNTKLFRCEEVCPFPPSFKMGAAPHRAYLSSPWRIPYTCMGGTGTDLLFPEAGVKDFISAFFVKSKKRKFLRFFRPGLS